MKCTEKVSCDIDDLARRIEQRIKELEEEEAKKTKKKEYVNDELGDDMSNMDEIIKEIDRRIAELEKEEEINLDDLTNKVNEKLDKLDEYEIEDDLEKTKYDLEEISRQINETIKALEAKRKERKRKKAMYCDMARKGKCPKKKK